jgi:DNA-binding NarL/FixJ family response regulator
MPINGVEATKIIRKEFPELKIIALTSYDSKSFVQYDMLEQFPT